MALSLRNTVIVSGVFVALLALGEAPAFSESRRKRAEFTTPCVDSIKDAKAKLLAGRSHSAQERLALKFYTLDDEYAADLDGDGGRDIFVSEIGYSGSGGNVWYLYIRRGDCSHFVGQVAGRDLRPLKKGNKGLLDFRIETRGGLEFRHHYDWRFDGNEYQLVRTRECNWHWGHDTLICKKWEK